MRELAQIYRTGRSDGTTDGDDGIELTARITTEDATIFHSWVVEA